MLGLKLGLEDAMPKVSKNSQLLENEMVGTRRLELLTSTVSR